MSLYSLQTFGQLEPFLQQEWLLTNGLGGFAFSTVVGCNTRRYHGLLVAATKPPLGRMVTLSRFGEMLIIDGESHRPHELAVNQFRDYFHPRGERYLQQFDLDDTARWTYDVAGVRVVKELLVPWMKNAVGVRYLIDPGEHEVEFRVWPFFAMRDFHALRGADGCDLPAERSPQGVTVSAGDLTLHVRADDGEFVQDPAWWYGHVYVIETDRGQDDVEDTFTPGRFTLRVDRAMTLTIWASLDATERLDWDIELRQRREAFAAATRGVGDGVTATLTKLTRAANDFIVYRKAPDGSDGTTVIAGYPWFADWGRDTMIALPGLLLATGQFDRAKQVLSLFAAYVSEGMIPNRFNDYTNEPEYNTVDASLWFIHACHEYLRLSKDQPTFDRILKRACRAIIDGYRRGTRFGIRMDESDGLITQGDTNTQLTWMDAKCNGVAYTPRQGKPVEINALWYHALVLMGETTLAGQVAASLRQAFWISPLRGLADVVRGAPLNSERDESIRPNQIFAVSLPNSALTEDQQRAVVEVVRRELLTPFGLRTLARSDPKYCGRYCGPQAIRDQAYHNGTVWPWLMGPFVDAYLHVNERSEDALAQARRWLAPLVGHLDDACIGQMSEIFEPDEPHRAVGCCAQAWSIAEVLRVALEVGA